MIYMSMQVPEGLLLASGPRFMSGTVVRGAGRGSRQMGVPTANLDPEPLAEQLKGLEPGVYFGYGGSSRPLGCITHI